MGGDNPMSHESFDLAGTSYAAQPPGRNAPSQDRTGDAELHSFRRVSRHHGPQDLTGGLRLEPQALSCPGPRQDRPESEANPPGPVLGHHGLRLTNRGAALLIAASAVFFTVCTHIGLGQ